MVIKPKGLTEGMLKRANIGQDYWEVDFKNYYGPENPMKATKRYLENLAEMKEKGLGLLYLGPPGPGKTTLAMITFKYLVRARWNIFCTSLGEIVENIQKSWHNSDDNNTSEFIERARRADFLFIDDVGKEHRGQSGFVQTVFDNLVRYRVQHRLPTFLTTNLTKSELQNTYGEGAMSLLEGKLIGVVVEGDDVRRTKLKGEARQSLRRRVVQT